MNFLGVCGYLILAGYAVSWVFLVHEMKNAPEMYFDEDGNLRKLEWFEDNGLTHKMWYDFERTEKFDYQRIHGKPLRLPEKIEK